MRQVTVKKEFYTDGKQVATVLTPRRIIRCEGTYEIVNVNGDSSPLSVTVKHGKLKMTLKFTKKSNGYIYKQVGDTGPFEEMETTITYEGSNPVTVCAESRFTFGLPFPAITDRIAGWNRKTELHRLLLCLANVISTEESEGTGS